MSVHQFPGGRLDALLGEQHGVRRVAERDEAVLARYPPDPAAEAVIGEDGEHTFRDPCGAPGLIRDCLGATAAGGIICLVGVSAPGKVFDLDIGRLNATMVLDNDAVFGTVNAGRDAFEASIRDLGAFVDSWPEAVRSVITGRFPMAAHRDLLLGKSGGIKNVIELN